jgi:hypothetical protein
LCNNEKGLFDALAYRAEVALIANMAEKHHITVGLLRRFFLVIFYNKMEREMRTKRENILIVSFLARAKKITISKISGIIKI